MPGTPPTTPYGATQRASPPVRPSLIPAPPGSSLALARNLVPPGLTVGARVYVNKNGGAFGTVRFLGETEFAPDLWAGIQLDLPVGKNDGSIHGRAYFHCQYNHGLFVRPSVCKVLMPESPGQHEQQRTRRPPFASFTGRAHSLTQSPPAPTATARSPAAPSFSTAATALRPHASPPTVATTATVARATGGMAVPSSGAGRGNEELMVDLLVEEEVEQQVKEQVKAVEQQMASKLQQIVGKVVDRLTGLEERIDATVVEFKQAQQQRRQEQQEVVSHEQQQQEQQEQIQEEEHAQVLAVIQKLAQEAKVAIFQGVQEQCEAMAVME